MLKKEILLRKGMEKANDGLLKATIAFEKYNTPACWKGKPTVVTANLRKCLDEKDQRSALEANIEIRVKGFGWKEWHITKTVKNVKRPIKELSAHLRNIIKYENANEDKIPDKPHAEPPQRTATPVLGTLTDERRQLDVKHLEKIGGMRKAVGMLRKERKERNGKDSMYDLYQDWINPKLETLIGERIDICWPLTEVVEGGKKVKKGEWCQGKVIEIVNKADHEVKVEWDAIPDVAGFEQQQESNCFLRPDFWKKLKHWGWRKDIDVELFDNYYKETDEVEQEEGEEGNADLESDDGNWTTDSEDKVADIDDNNEETTAKNGD